MCVCVCVFVGQYWRRSGRGAHCVFQLKGHITPVRTVAFSPDGLALASGGVGGLMNIWSLRVGHTHTQTHTHLHLHSHLQKWTTHTKGTPVV